MCLFQFTCRDWGFKSLIKTNLLARLSSLRWVSGEGGRRLVACCISFLTFIQLKRTICSDSLRVAQILSKATKRRETQCLWRWRVMWVRWTWTWVWWFHSLPNDLDNSWEIWVRTALQWSDWIEERRPNQGIILVRRKLMTANDFSELVEKASTHTWRC